jgi:hypothetical protein
MTKIWKEKGGNGLDWPRVVRDYVRSLAYEKIPDQPGGPVRVIYNGENPVGDAVYQIFPKQNLPWSTVKAFTEKLETNHPKVWKNGCDVGSDNMRFVMFWELKLSPEQVEMYKNDPVVSHVLSCISGRF